LRLFHRDFPVVGPRTVEFWAGLREEAALE
jgi:hypothetical protein